MGLLNSFLAANPHTLPANLEAARGELVGRDAIGIVQWALERAARPVISTNFRPGAAALLHLVSRVRPGLPVVWVDTGLNTPATYEYVERLRACLDLDLRCYVPRQSTARLCALHQGVPRPGDPRFTHFVQAIKLEPFERAFNELAPDVWFTGIRREQTAYRRELGVVSRGARNTLRVAPLFDWDAAQVRAYLANHDIPDNTDYVDPTKPDSHLECGLQRLA